MLISHDIDTVLYHFLQFREILTYAVLTKGTNKLVKKFSSYHALTKQLATNRKCSIENLVTSTIEDGNCELLDLLEKSNAEPGRYFNKHIYRLLIAKCKLDTIRWFNNYLNLNLDMDDVIHRVILNACHDKSQLEMIKDQQNFISNNLNCLHEYVRYAVSAANFKVVDWFCEKYPEKTKEYLALMISNPFFLNEAPDDRLIIRWFVEHEYVDLSKDNILYKFKVLIIRDSGITDMYGDKAIKFLKAEPYLISRFVVDIALIRKYEKDLLQYRSKISGDMDNIIDRIICRNDHAAFNWICLHFKIVFKWNDVVHAFKNGCTKIIQYLAGQMHGRDMQISFLNEIASLDKYKTHPISQFAEKFKYVTIKKEHITGLISKAIHNDNTTFLEWLFKYSKIDSHRYFSTNQLKNIYDLLGKNKYVNVTKFFVDHGYDICITCDLSFITNYDRHFLKYILGNPSIKKKFCRSGPNSIIERIIFTEDVEILQWYMETYMVDPRADKIKHILYYMVKYGTEQQVLWFLDNTVMASGFNIIYEQPQFGMLALLCCRRKIIDWLRNKCINVNHPYELINQLVGKKKFDMIHYLREYCRIKIQFGTYETDSSIHERNMDEFVNSLAAKPNCYHYPDTHVPMPTEN